jgi:hypothetical protein
MNIVLHLPGDEERTVKMNTIPRIGENFFVDGVFYKIDELIYDLDDSEGCRVLNMVSRNEKLNAELGKEKRL